MKKTVDKSVDLRRATRFTSRFPVELDLGGGVIVEADMVDVSSGGFRMISSAPIAAGSRIRLRADTLPPVPARIIWNVGGAFGCAFDQPLNAVSVLALRAHSGERRSASGPSPAAAAR
jgi:hypothetical protein